MKCINTDNSYAPSIGTTNIPGLLFANDLTVLSITSYNSQKEMAQIVIYCIEHLKLIYVNIKSKYRKGAKLKKPEK
jgi:hypothetical protein